MDISTSTDKNVAWDEKLFDLEGQAYQRGQNDGVQDAKESGIHLRYSIFEDGVRCGMMKGLALGIQIAISFLNELQGSAKYKPLTKNRFINMASAGRGGGGRATKLDTRTGLSRPIINSSPGSNMDLYFELFVTLFYLVQQTAVKPTYKDDIERDWRLVLHDDTVHTIQQVVEILGSVKQ